MGETSKIAMKMRKKGFTLIELLVVIAIIGLLFVLAIPTFENAGKKNLDRPAQQLANTIRLARQSAIVKRQWTFLVIPTRIGNTFKSEEDFNKCLRAYAVMASTNLPGNPIYTSFADFEKVFISDWTYLPDGIYFEEEYASSVPGKIANYSFDSGRIVAGSLDPAKPADGSSQLAVMAFAPDGQVRVPSKSTTTDLQWNNEPFPSFYLASDRYYERNGLSLADSIPLKGTNVRVKVARQRGGVTIENVR